MELSPSWEATHEIPNILGNMNIQEAASCAVTQEFLNILWKQKVHYRVHKSTLLPIQKWAFKREH
jgi:hypothetical protein